MVILPHRRKAYRAGGTTCTKWFEQATGTDYWQPNGAKYSQRFEGSSLSGAADVCDLYVQFRSGSGTSTASFRFRDNNDPAAGAWIGDESDTISTTVTSTSGEKLQVTWPGAFPQIPVSDEVYLHILYGSGSPRWVSNPSASPGSFGVWNANGQVGTTNDFRCELWLDL